MEASNKSGNKLTIVPSSYSVYSDVKCTHDNAKAVFTK